MPWLVPTPLVVVVLPISIGWEDFFIYFFFQTFQREKISEQYLRVVYLCKSAPGLHTHTQVKDDEAFGRRWRHATGNAVATRGLSTLSLSSTRSSGIQCADKHTHAHFRLTDKYVTQTTRTITFLKKIKWLIDTREIYSLLPDSLLKLWERKVHSTKRNSFNFTTVSLWNIIVLHYIIKWFCYVLYKLDAAIMFKSLSSLASA